MTNIRKSRLSVYKKDRIIKYFVSGSLARTAASLIGVSKFIVAYFLLSPSRDYYFGN